MDWDEGYTKRVSVLIGVVWAPSVYFFDSWAKDRGDSDPFVIIVGIILILVTFAASPFLILFGVLVLLSPFAALIGLFQLLQMLLLLPGICVELGLWCLSWRWALRSARYPPRSSSCSLCGRCANIVEQSRILRGTRWTLARPREDYDFHGIDQLQQSAETCHLCSLLWHTSFKSITSDPDSSTPLLAGNIGSHISSPKVTVDISATRPFGQEQSLHIRLCAEGYGPFPSLTIKDTGSGFAVPQILSLLGSTVVHGHKCKESITSSKSDIDWAKSMVAKCERDHDYCRNLFIPSDRRRYVPKRLIDVRFRNTGSVRLVLGEKISAGDDAIQYAALSHCWGTTVKCELTENNRESMETIEIETLDQNFRDAVDITYKMGIGYLWIDSLCIMQRSEEWEEQSADMGLVYARAKCIISATASENSRGGCYKRQDLFPYDCSLCSSYDYSLVVCSPFRYPALVRLFDSKVERSFLAKRGWTFQERFLASRILHFCSGLILFECNTLIASPWHGEETYHLNTAFRQDGTRRVRVYSDPGPEPPEYNYDRTIIQPAGISTKPFSRPARAWVRKTKRGNPGHFSWTMKKYRYDQQVKFIHKNSARLSMRGAFSFLWSFKGTTEQEQAEFHLRWYEMVTAYSVRNLTKESDKLIAITGIAYFVQQNTDLKYIAGLWDRMLPFNLLWIVDGERRRPTSSVATWSWASVNGKISHRLHGSWEHIEPLISSVGIEATHTVNGLVHNATLKLSCTLRSFDPKIANVIYDTSEHHPRDEIRYLPILKLAKNEAQIHGILVRAVPVIASQTEDTWVQYRRLGYFWALETDIHLGEMYQEGQQLIELV